MSRGFAIVVLIAASAMIWRTSSAKAEEGVTICHVPPGDPAAAETLVVGASAVKAHLNNHAGDVLGSCEERKN